jgi:cell division protein FtsQ
MADCLLNNNMSIKSNIRKIVFLSLTVAVAGCLLVLLVAAIKRKNQQTCEGVTVSITNKRDFTFLNRQEVLKILVPGETPQFKGKALNVINLQELEARLERHVWVKDAELFFDNNALLRINITEREPQARVFSAGGNSFYLDKEYRQLPLSDRVSIKIPVFTGYPFEKIRKADSSLLRQILELSRFIAADSFWMAQIAQVDITPQNSFELVPVIGKHIVQLGDGNNCEAKFHRLLLFYQQVSATAGMDKYSIINIQYDQQVIGTRQGTVSKIDSMQAVKNIRQMIEAARQLQIDSAVSTSVDNNIIPVGPTDTSLTVFMHQQQSKMKKDSLLKKSRTQTIFHPPNTKPSEIRPLNKP